MSRRGCSATAVDRVVLLWVGATAVLASIDSLLGDRRRPMTARGRAPPERFPTTASGRARLISATRASYSTSIAAFGSAAVPALEWLAGQLDGRASVGHVLARAAQLLRCRRMPRRSDRCRPWRWNCAEPALLDVAGLRRADPVDARCRGVEATTDRAAGQPDAARGDVARRSATRRASAPSCACREGWSSTTSSVMSSPMHSSPPPAPWSAAAEFRAWLAPRYWPALHDQRPRPVDRLSRSRAAISPAFRRWCREAFTVDDVPLLLTPPSVRTQSADRRRAFAHRRPQPRRLLHPPVGSRRCRAALREAVDQAGVPHSTVPHNARPARRRVAPLSTNRVEFTNSLCVVTADQFPFLADDFPRSLRRHRADDRLLVLGARARPAAHAPVDRLRRRDLGRIAVRHRCVRRGVARARATCADPGRRTAALARAIAAAFRCIADARERPLFLTVFDHLSVTERKNPLGVIEAFRRAFAPDEGPVLVIKTMNGHQRWANHQRVLAAADGRADIRVWDEALERSRSDGVGRRRGLHGVVASQRRARACTSPRRCGWARRPSPPGTAATSTS